MQDFECDKSNCQQTLHSILNHGRHLLTSGHIEDSKKLEENLRLLSDQWQGIVERARTWKSIINDRLRDWHSFNSLKQLLKKWLRSKQSEMRLFQFKRFSITQISNDLDHAKVRDQFFSFLLFCLLFLHAVVYILLLLWLDFANED